MNHVLCGLARNTALPAELVDRLISVADEDVAASLAGRADLSRAQAVGLSARVARSAVQLVREGRLTALDIDPPARPDAALALLDEGSGKPEWARRFACFSPNAAGRHRVKTPVGFQERRQRGRQILTPRPPYTLISASVTSLMSLYRTFSMSSRPAR
ncbi:hypothetical protein [Streptomyces sp. NBC_00656]|uniref:hypothetical protein n=1 Tax=Streptomyces sp. NBC_00656 TaxID=2903668 RepID=UPI00386C685A